MENITKTTLKNISVFLISNIAHKNKPQVLNVEEWHLLLPRWGWGGSSYAQVRKKIHIRVKELHTTYFGGEPIPYIEKPSCLIPISSPSDLGEPLYCIHQNQHPDSSSLV